MNFFDENLDKEILVILTDIEEHSYYSFKKDDFFNHTWDVYLNKKCIGSFRIGIFNFSIEPDDLEKYTGCSCPIDHNEVDLNLFKSNLISCFNIKFTIQTIFDFL